MFSVSLRLHFALNLLASVFERSTTEWKKKHTLKLKIGFIYICLFLDAHKAYELHLVFTLRDFIHPTLCALTYLRVPFIVQVEIDSFGT